MGHAGQPPQYNTQGYGGMPQRHPNPMGMGRTPGPGPGPIKNNTSMMMNRRSASAPYPPQMMSKTMPYMPNTMPNSRPMQQYPNGAQVNFATWFSLLLIGRKGPVCGQILDKPAANQGKHEMWLPKTGGCLIEVLIKTILKYFEHASLWKLAAKQN